MYGYETSIYVVDSYEWSIIFGITLTLIINCDITLVEMDDKTCLRRLVISSHVPSVSPLSASHSHDCHVRCTISHSNPKLGLFRDLLVRMLCLFQLATN